MIDCNVTNLKELNQLRPKSYIFYCIQALHKSKRLFLYNTSIVLAAYYVKHQINQMDSSIFWYFIIQLLYTNYQIGQGNFFFLWHFYSLFACCAGYQIGQRKSFIGTWRLILCKILNKSDTIFYFLIFNGSTICNQVRLSNEHRDKIYTIKV